MAHKKGLGSSRNGRDSNAKRLGVKVFAGEAVTGGEIIVRQRGTKFKPGDGVGIGKDDTIYARAAGTVSSRAAGAVGSSRSSPASPSPAESSSRHRGHRRSRPLGIRIAARTPRTRPMDAERSETPKQR